MSFHVEKVEKVEKVEEQTRDLSQTDQQDSCYSAAADQTLSPSDSRAYNNKKREMYRALLNCLTNVANDKQLKTTTNNKQRQTTNNDKQR